MNKTNNTCFVFSVCATIIIGFLVISKLGCHHHRWICESTGKDFDSRLKEFITALDKVTKFVQHASDQAQ